ncbi:Hypothetical predicted protein [Olea europaea subsp. europaea]|uniref:Uncharacterized protein n=1 Tax=Olea europaea subsp. europaea TaxID=158383 RepID=A0A8S0QBR0_OLEEU|nr:Hypothetical predicted protein [Olea europaea subsp. europaea]
MGINPRPIKCPRFPLPFPLFPSPDCAARLAKSLAGGPQHCRCASSFPTTTVDVLDGHPKHLPPAPPPADPLSHYWTQSTTPSTPSSSPRLTDHRPALRLHRRSPEHRRSSTPARPRRILRRKP